MAKSGPMTAIVIGAGVGGVSTAARLAKAGFKVTVLEKNSFTGGRCSLIHYTTNDASATYRFDQGPSLLLLPGLFHRTFHDLNTTLENEGVTLLKCEPNYNIWFGDGSNFQMSSDLALMKTEIEKWEGKEGYERYLQYLGEAHKHYELSVEHVLLKNFTSLGRTYSLLQYTELAEGIWYPVGGFHRVVEALVKVGERLGVEYRLNTAAKKILLSEDGKKAKGVVLEDGRKLEADVVVNNSDLVYAYENLLPESEYAESLKSRPGSCSSISFYWALDRKVKELGAHNIFLADEYRESFDSIFKKHLIPDEPSFYVNVPSRVDPTAAPEDKDSIVVLVPVGHLVEDGKASPPTANGSTTNGSIQSASPNSTTGITPTETQDWPAMISLARKTILSTIASRTGVDISAYIIHEISNDPSTWKSTFNLDRGAILGLSHSFFNVLCFRPTTRARQPSPMMDKYLTKFGVLGRVVEVVIDLIRRRGRDVKGLYMVGASAHPGTGVPICLAGGGLVARQICEDYGVEVPWKVDDEMSVKRGGRLDKIERPIWLDSWEQWCLIVFLAAVIPWLLMWLWGK
ncbi:hypothetical protein AC578_3018 [Pseudocercospora eumusae]|uniref:Phytoene desaturase n=1 Tax=Pseudocercospora eumusae TaxID=321146 RepID=A0A139H212_9PEZI|nr:hypothetical protein AC578_3018 [Pseudocercospora eumusae]